MTGLSLRRHRKSECTISPKQRLECDECTNLGKNNDYPGRGVPAPEGGRGMGYWGEERSKGRVWREKLASGGGGGNQSMRQGLRWREPPDRRTRCRDRRAV